MKENGVWEIAVVSGKEAPTECDCAPWFTSASSPFGGILLAKLVLW